MQRGRRPPGSSSAKQALENNQSVGLEDRSVLREEGKCCEQAPSSPAAASLLLLSHPRETPGRVSAGQTTAEVAVPARGPSSEEGNMLSTGCECADVRFLQLCSHAVTEARSKPFTDTYTLTHCARIQHPTALRKRKTTSTAQTGNLENIPLGCGMVS